MLPQSPKFLVENGKLDEALMLLKRMYAVNRRKPADTFPVRFKSFESFPFYLIASQEFGYVLETRHLSYYDIFTLLALFC